MASFIRSVAQRLRSCSLCCFFVSFLLSFAAAVAVIACLCCGRCDWLSAVAAAVVVCLLLRLWLGVGFIVVTAAIMCWLLWPLRAAGSRRCLSGAVAAVGLLFLAVAVMVCSLLTPSCDGLLLAAQVLARSDASFSHKRRSQRVRGCPERGSSLVVRALTDWLWRWRHAAYFAMKVLKKVEVVRLKQVR